MLLKHNEILFHQLCSNQNPALASQQLLNELTGITHVEVVSDNKIYVSYDLNIISLVKIEGLLHETGFRLDNRLLTKLKRAIIHFTEETQRANLRYDEIYSHSIRNIYVSRYKHLPHGCRDHRPSSHWRNYL